MIGRYSYKYDVDSVEILVNKLLSLSEDIDHISILLSNQNSGKFFFPKEYISYDIVAGIDSINELRANNNSLNSLQEFYESYSDWMFGYISYDIKNEIEEFVKEDDLSNADKVYFFIPKYLLLVKNNKMEVLTYQSKQETDDFISSLSMFSRIKNQNIILQSRESKKDYLDKIKLIQKHIQRGDIYEMNYCVEYFAENKKLSPQQLFIDLNSVAKTPFASFVRLNNNYIICASPERFMKRTDNTLISQPIKGTIKRGLTKQEDKILYNKLKKSNKDISENIMIVDLVRNDLSKISNRGSVNVDELCEVYAFENVYQMISTVSAKVTSNICFKDVLRASFPMGSMTGAPKLKAMELIDDYEERSRGIFSGSLGYINPDGDFDFNVIIRTILYNSTKKYLSASVGGAITAKSDPESEYQECLIKISPIREVLNNYA